MVHYKLTYFPIRGAGEIARQIFAYAGQDYEDVRVPQDQWPALKPKTQFGQLPLLEVDGKELAQSHAIARYLATEFGLNGTNDWEEAQVNAIADQFKDYLSEVRPYLLILGKMAEGNANEVRTDLFIPAFKKHFTFFEKLVVNSSSGYLVGNSLTWVDLLISQHVEDILHNDLAVVEEFKKLLQHRKKIQGSDRIRKWIETRPETPF